MNKTTIETYYDNNIIDLIVITADNISVETTTDRLTYISNINKCQRKSVKETTMEIIKRLMDIMEDTDAFIVSLID